MTATIFGICADRLGHHHDRLNVSPAANYLRHQPSRIPVDLEHRTAPLGEVVYLERANGNLHAVAVVNFDVDELDAYGDCWWSAATHAHRTYGIDRHLQLDSLAITKTPASIGLAPLRWLPGDVRDGTSRWAPIPELIARAAQPAIERRHRLSAPVLIHDVERRTTPAQGPALCPPIIVRDDTMRRPWGAPIEHKRCGPILSVR
jgi:hypothetical protein